MDFKYTLLLLIAVSCTSQKTNQYIKTGPDVQQRHGLWLERSNDGDGETIVKGKYNRGEKTGKWLTTYNGKKFEIDRYKNGISKTKIFHLNGKIMEKGQSKTEISPNERWWYYFGDWKYYDDKGHLLYIKKYDKGSAVDSISVKN